MTSPAHDVLPIICTDYTYDSELDIADGVPLKRSDAARGPEGELGQTVNQGYGQGFFICHMINYTGYNQKWNVDQIRSAQWTVQRIKII